jgi:hypothetical protein
MRMDVNGFNSSALEQTLSCEHLIAEQCLFGETISTIQYQGKKALNVPCSETKHQKRGSRQSLSDKLTPLLIASGLVRGITPKSVRKQLGAQILDIASNKQDGTYVERQKTDCPSLSAHRSMGSNKSR